MEDFDVGAVIGCILSFAIYHLYTYSSVFCLQNENIQLARNISNSFFWIQKHRAFPDAASVTLAGKILIIPLKSNQSQLLSSPVKSFQIIESCQIGICSMPHTYSWLDLMSFISYFYFVFIVSNSLIWRHFTSFSRSLQSKL